ncbi:uncharacterized protein LOC127131010 [Lathyrus oleraceus]|uniref:uncharacterized protein LOC127131010 n=1 Tax=Pisum sativum TaxID=3888 RepID=UPI0021D0882A|nr:uncharacterized protein LOC127131010 [Pisum sativum]
MKKSSKGSGKPPLTPKKRKVSTANVILVEDDEEDTPPTPLKKKQKKNKDKPTTPLISTANQSDPSSYMNPSPPPTISGAVQNKGSSTGAQNLEEDNAQNEQETSSPGEDGKRDLKHVDKKDSAEKEDSEDTPSNSPARVEFPSDDADEDDQDSDEIEGYFQEDEDMNMGEADPEGNQTRTGDANIDTVPNPIKVRPSIIQTSPISLTEEEKKALKQNDPLKYVRLMMTQRESSSEQSISGASTHSGASANEASHDELLQQVKKAVFDVDLFEELRNDVGASFGIKKMISKINITAYPTDIGEALIDNQNLIDQVCAEYQLQKKISDAKAKQAAIQGLDNTEADDLAKQSVDHVEKATAMNEDIARLRGVQAAVQYKIGLAKKKYDRMRATIPF